MRDGWTNPSRPSVVSGERVSRGSAATKSAASLTAFTSLPFAVPGCSPRPSMMHLQLPGGEGLDLDLADSRPVEGVGGLGAERLDVEVVGAPPDLLVDRERRRAPSPAARRVPRRYATAAMISATPALSSAPRSVVPSLVTMSCPTRAASAGSSAGSRIWLGSPGSTIGSPA